MTCRLFKEYDPTKRLQRRMEDAWRALVSQGAEELRLIRVGPAFYDAWCRERRIARRLWDKRWPKVKRSSFRNWSQRQSAALPVVQSIDWPTMKFIDAKPASGDKPRQPVSQSPRRGRECCASPAGASGCFSDGVGGG